MGEDTIVESTNGSIKILRFNKPRRKNAIDRNMYIKVTEILKEAASNDAISMVVFTGTGDFYSSGNDLFAETDTFQDTLLDVIHDLIKAIITFPKMLIAIVNGPAVGVATTTLAMFDFVYASENAYFYTPFSKLGLVAEGCSSYTFPRLLGVRKAMELLVLNKKMPAKEALECGLVNNVWSSEELQDKAWEQINELTTLPQHSLNITKKLIRRSRTDKLLEACAVEFEELKKINISRSKL